MVHAELRFSYRNPSGCVMAGVFDEDASGEAFRYVESRDVIKSSELFWNLLTSPPAFTTKADRAIRYLEGRPLTAY